MLFLPGRGGARKGAGRPRSSSRRRVSHHGREELSSSHPVHVTVRMIEGMPSLRRRAEHRALLTCFHAMLGQSGFALNEYSIQSNHIHMVVEVDDRGALARAMHSLNRRIACALNRLWKRKGSVFADRYFAVALTCPTQVRNALRYVLNNARHHGLRLRGPDVFSSARWFDGWRRIKALAIDPRRSPVSKARTWLQFKGWRCYGLLIPNVLRG